MTPDIKVITKNRRAYLLQSIREMLTRLRVFAALSQVFLGLLARQHGPAF